MASEDIEAARDSVQKKIDKLDFSKIQPMLREMIEHAIPMIQEGQRVADQDLESWGLPKVGGDIDKLYELAQMTGRNADPMTYSEVVNWAIDLKREATIRRQVEIDSGTATKLHGKNECISVETLTCWNCSCRIDSGTTCKECQRREGKMIALQIAINQDNVERIEEWPQLRALLKSKFGFDKDVHALWENMIDWLFINNGLDENDVINLRIADVPKLLEFHGNKESVSGETPSNETPLKLGDAAHWRIGNVQACATQAGAEALVLLRSETGEWVGTFDAASHDPICVGLDDEMLFLVHEDWVVFRWKPISHDKQTRFVDARKISINTVMQWCDSNGVEPPFELMKRLPRIDKGQSVSPETPVVHPNKDQQKSVSDTRQWVRLSQFTKTLGCDKTTSKNYVEKLPEAAKRKDLNGHWEVDFDEYLNLLKAKPRKWTLPTNPGDLEPVF